jgi:hypothetical protein
MLSRCTHLWPALAENGFGSRIEHESPISAATVLP